MFNVFLFEFKKLINNPIALIFSFAIPILAIITVGILYDKTTIPNSKVKVIDFCFPAYAILSIYSLSGITVSTLISNDRIEKRIKQISLSKFGITKYIFGIIAFHLLIYLIGFFIMTLISFLFFDLTLSPKKLLILVLFPILVFIFVAFFFLFFSNLCNTQKLLLTVTLVLFYLSIFLSGATIPLFLFPSWWKYFNYIFPPGLCVFIFTNLLNGESFANNWYVFIIFSFDFFIFALLAIKTFKWD